MKKFIGNTLNIIGVHYLAGLIIFIVVKPMPWTEWVGTILVGGILSAFWYTMGQMDGVSEKGKPPKNNS